MDPASPSSPVPGGESRPVEVAAGLVFRDGRLLITRRRAGDHLGGLWEFPGGKREAVETWEACLVRELREELGIEVVVGRLIESLTHHYAETSVELRFFLCRWREHEPRPLGCEGILWVSRDELGQFEFPAADARLLDKLRSSTELWG